MNMETKVMVLDYKDAQFLEAILTEGGLRLHPRAQAIARKIDVNFRSDAKAHEFNKEYCGDEMQSDEEFTRFLLDKIGERQEVLQTEIERLEDNKGEIKEVIGHLHEWGENDYCIICGMDGRA